MESPTSAPRPSWKSCTNLLPYSAAPDHKAVPSPRSPRDRNMRPHEKASRQIKQLLSQTAGSCFYEKRVIFTGQDASNVFRGLTKIRGRLPQAFPAEIVTTSPPVDTLSCKTTKDSDSDTPPKYAQESEAIMHNTQETQTSGSKSESQQGSCFFASQMHVASIYYICCTAKQPSVLSVLCNSIISKAPN